METKQHITRKHYNNIIAKLVQNRGMEKEDATIWADKKFVIDNSIEKGWICSCGHKLSNYPEEDHEEYCFECPNCGKEYEWGT